MQLSQSMSRTGLAVRTSVRFRFGSPFSSKLVVCGHCLLTLSLTIDETLKWLSSLPNLMQKSFWWWQCSDRYIISLPPPFQTSSPHPFSPSLISLMASVNVKHQAYLLRKNKQNNQKWRVVAYVRGTDAKRDTDAVVSASGIHLSM